MAALIVLVAFVVLDLAVWRFGADSRVPGDPHDKWRPDTRVPWVVQRPRLGISRDQ